MTAGLAQAVQFALGLTALVAGASILVKGASLLALRIGLSPLVVGLTVVAFGTSAPELAVSTGAVIAGQTGLALGNVVGSNIFNVLFILGLAALIAPLEVHRQVIRQEVPIMFCGAVLLLVCSADGRLGALDGAVLLGLLVVYTAFLVRQSRAEPRGEDQPAPTGWKATLAGQLALVIGGLALLVLGSEALVGAATAFARALGVSEVVIGLTLVAAGTSLPEVATSLIAAFKGERDIAVGNVVGSCVFNLFGVAGAAALAAIFSQGTPLPVPSNVLNFDLWVMLAALGACFPVFITGRRIARWEGALFLAYYVAYTVYLILALRRHEGVEGFADAMLGFVIPLTAVTLAVSVLRQRR